ncbi:N-acetylglucosamine-6-phosphate deacetylase [Arthrobacter sp. CAN_A212]|uniref:N-acetylglucosamine-6-phosphate deacetylase n=1 Tax=unclassified Arthrobacter TaxID=235627 RepID=UPI0018CA2F5F|nr:amidohydrolase family protein [Arthrobacter sp. CAN_C5]MBP2216154.1 N-acetylglucosamine-6-phosphate deacetylase [Arthrobacter sp. CAN_C5]
MVSNEIPGRSTVRYIRGRIITEAGIIDDGVLAVDGDRISFAGPAAAFDGGSAPADREFPPGSILLPGLVDTHCHGANGGDFANADVSAARRAVDFLHRSGTTTVLASTMTAPRQDLINALAVLAGLAEEGVIAGIHAEGPFVSVARCGAQNPDYISDPEPDYVADLIEAAQGRLKTMTYAPELPGADALVDILTTHGITPSLGHTDADADTAAASLSLAWEEMESSGFDGYSMRPTVTHLFNGMPPLHHRSPGPVAACLRAAKAGTAVVELIADNAHLDPQTVLTVFDLVGSENITLVTDSMAAAGLPDGNYHLGSSAVTVANGVATLDRTGSLAGGTAVLLDVVRRTVDAGVPLKDAVASATAVPANVLGLADEIGSLRLGLRADAVVVTADLALLAVLREGVWLEPF